MFRGPKSPRDRTPYPRSPDSRELQITEAVGRYVFVVDVNEVIHVAPDGSHMHPKVLGNAAPALYAGELTIDRPGNVAEVTNLSGTFQFKSQMSLCCVVSKLRETGFTVANVFWYPPSGATGPVQLVCP
jgi:hypothetical protein